MDSDNLENPKKRENKIGFPLIAILLAISLFIGGLFGFWAGYVTNSSRIDNLEGQLSIIEDQIRSIQATSAINSQNQSDVLEIIGNIENELSRIRNEIDNLEAPNSNDLISDQIIEEIDELKIQLSTLQEQINNINATTLIHEDITYVIGENYSLSQLFEQVKESVVVVQAVVSPTTTSQGSGFLYNYSGQIIILTNSHVVEDATSIDVTFSNGNMYSASLKGANSNTDIAVLTTSGPQTEYSPLSIVSSDTLRVGDPVVVVGTPYGLPGSMSNGIISALNRTITLEDTTLSNIIQTTTPLNPGNSGGPMINYLGQVIGMATAIVEDSQGIGFAIPSNTILQEVIEIMS